MKSKKIFMLTHPAGSERVFRTKDGETGKQTCASDVGYIHSSANAMKAIVLEGSTDKELWQILNFVDQQNIYLATVAVLGATSPEHAIDSALRTFNQDFDGIATCTPYDVIEAPAFVLERFLSNESRARFKSRVTEKELLKLHQKITMNPVVWTGDTCLSSHSDVGALVSDMVRYDPMRLMQESVTPAAMTSIITDGAETAQFDSIVSQVTRLDGLSKRILSALGSVADKVKPVNVTKTDPFKKHGVVNIAQIYEMADGQTVTIVFHNPDSTPARLDPKDLVTSWKFLLNKRDVTAALQPKSGKDVNIAQLATRMMKIVDANSSRFIRGQERKAKAEKALVELGNIEVEKQQQINELDTEIQLLQAELDQDMASSINTPENIASPAETQVNNDVATTVDAVDDPNSPDYLKANEALYKTLKEDLQELVPDQTNTAYQAKREKMEQVTALLKKNGIAIDESAPVEPEITRYSIKNPKPRSRKPIGFVRLTAQENGLYDVLFSKDSVGGEYVGDIEGVKRWLAVRMQTMGGAVSGAENSWEDVSQQLDLTAGDDILGIKNAEVKPEPAQVVQEEETAEERKARRIAMRAEVVNARKLLTSVSDEQWTAMSNQFFAGLPVDEIRSNLLFQISGTPELRTKAVNKINMALQWLEEQKNPAQQAEEPIQAAKEPETVADNPDELWLDQIIAGNVDLVGLSMADFAEVAEKYASDTATTIYAKLEQALNAITVAKMDKAKAVQG